MSDDDDYDDETEEQEVEVFQAVGAAERLSLADLVGIGMVVAANCHAAIGQGLNTVGQCLFNHARYVRQQREAEEFEAYRQEEIEALHEMASYVLEPEETDG